MKHKHAELIKRWAEDTSLVVEYRQTPTHSWRETTEPSWAKHYEYRIRHKHQDLIDRKKERPELIVEIYYSDGWVEAADEIWWENYEYRLVEPQKPKVKMWQWVIQREGTAPILTAYFYKENPVINPMYTIIQRADWTEIEVEE